MPECLHGIDFDVLNAELVELHKSIPNVLYTYICRQDLPKSIGISFDSLSEMTMFSVSKMHEKLKKGTNRFSENTMSLQMRAVGVDAVRQYADHKHA